MQWYIYRKRAKETGEKFERKRRIQEDGMKEKSSLKGKSHEMFKVIFKCGLMGLRPKEKPLMVKKNFRGFNDFIYFFFFYPLYVYSLLIK